MGQRVGGGEQLGVVPLHASQPLSLPFSMPPFHAFPCHSTLHPQPLPASLRLPLANPCPCLSMPLHSPHNIFLCLCICLRPTPPHASRCLSIPLSQPLSASSFLPELASGQLLQAGPALHTGPSGAPHWRADAGEEVRVWGGCVNKGLEWVSGTAGEDGTGWRAGGSGEGQKEEGGVD